MKSEAGIMNAETTLKGISMDRWRWIIQGQIEGRARDELTAQNIAKRRKKEIEALEKKLSVTSTRLSDAETKLSDVESELLNEKKRISQSIKNLLQTGSLSEEQIAGIFSIPLEQVLSIKEEIAIEK